MTEIARYTVRVSSHRNGVDRQLAPDGEFVMYKDHLSTLKPEGEQISGYPAAWMVRESERDHWDFCRLKRAATDLQAKGWEVVPLYAGELKPMVSAKVETGIFSELVSVLEWYANPEIYKPHPHGLAFDDRDLSFRAKSILSTLNAPSSEQISGKGVIKETRIEVDGLLDTVREALALRNAKAPEQISGEAVERWTGIEKDDGAVIVRWVENGKRRSLTAIVDTVTIYDIDEGGPAYKVSTKEPKP